MSAKIRFHLDESVNPRIAYALEAMGIDVTTSLTTGLRGAGDDKQWEFAVRNGRVLITHDEDFLSIAAKNPEHPGMIFCKQEGHSLGAIIVECSSVHGNYSDEEMKGRIEYI
jgi:predicted nuclease of predicted toxin-antitoxin system